MAIETKYGGKECRMDLDEVDAIGIANVPVRIRTRALRIIGDEQRLWPIYVNQFATTNPGEVCQLEWLIGLADSRGKGYLVELCKGADVLRKGY